MRPFSEELEDWSDEKKRFLLRKLYPAEHEKYLNSILPNIPEKVPFNEPLSMLSNIFGEKNSLSYTRWQCMEPFKDEILTKLEQDSKLMIQTVAEKCRKLSI